MNEEKAKEKREPSRTFAPFSRFRTNRISRNNFFPECKRCLKVNDVRGRAIKKVRGFQNSRKVKNELGFQLVLRLFLM